VVSFAVLLSMLSHVSEQSQGPIDHTQVTHLHDISVVKCYANCHG
jgi:hypothetical protein